MDILNQIVADKVAEVASKREIFPVKLLENSPYFKTPSVSLTAYLKREDKVGIIAEIKRRSPSKGILNENISVEELSIGYMQAGASALSVLTDSKYFAGSSDDLLTARKFNFCPILRKDFIVDEYQILEAKSIGADVILLIARILTPQKVVQFAKFAKALGLEVLLEIHSLKELQDTYCPEVDIVGVNNRDLDTLKMNTDLSFSIADQIPKEKIKISESGIDSSELIRDLKKVGYSGFLIGESFMKTSHPAKSCAKLIDQVRSGE